MELNDDERKHNILLFEKLGSPTKVPIQFLRDFYIFGRKAKQFKRHDIVKIKKKFLEKGIEKKNERKAKRQTYDM